jgi:uncharacterized protein YabE (DUF348 family)
MDNFKGIWDLGKEKSVFIVIALVAVIAISWFIFSAKNVTLIVDGKPTKLVVWGSTVQDVLHKAGVDIRDGDTVRPAQDSRVYEGSVIVAARQKKVEIVDGTEKKIAPMTMASLAEILVSQGITLGRDDMVKAQLDPEKGKLPSIKITRRDIKTYSERQIIAYSVKREPDDSLAPWESRIVCKGVNGILENTIRVVVENGKEIERKIVKTTTLKKPVNEIVRYSVAAVSRGNNSYRTVKELTMVATAYTHTGNRTATGTWPSYGTVAVDPRTIPLGTPLYVEGYGFAVAEDTGGAIKGHKVDVFLDNHNNARKWGRKTVKVQILRKVN